MADLNINRAPTKEEQRDMIIIGKRTPQDEFTEELAQEAVKAHKKGLPFAEQAAKKDRAEHHRIEVNRLMAKYGKGYFTEEMNKEYKHHEMDWAKYSDLNNFEIVNEFEVKDPGLTKKHNLPISQKGTKYKFKDHFETYTMMEDEHESYMRAKIRHDAIDWSKPKEEKVPSVSDDRPKKDKSYHKK